MKCSSQILRIGVFSFQGRGSGYWQASQVPPFSMASREQEFCSASVKALAAAVTSVWVAMTPRCSFLTTMVDFYDVFQGDDGRLDGHFIEDAEPFPEKAAAGGGEAAHLAGEGKVLAGEAGPDDVAVGDGGSADLLDGTEVEMVVAVIGGVAGGFLRADVVGPDRDAGMPGALGDKAAAREEIDKGWKSGVQ